MALSRKTIEGTQLPESNNFKVLGVSFMRKQDLNLKSINGDIRGRMIRAAREYASSKNGSVENALNFFNDRVFSLALYGGPARLEMLKASKEKNDIDECAEAALRIILQFPGCYPRDML